MQTFVKIHKEINSHLAKTVNITKSNVMSACDLSPSATLTQKSNKKSHWIHSTGSEFVEL